MLPISTVLPAPARQHVAGAKGVAGDAVLGRRDQDAQAQVEPRRHDHVTERQRGGGAAHVLLHQQHAAGRLDVEAAGIEADALADQRDPPAPRRRPQREVDQPRRPRAGAADGVDHGKIARQQVVADDARELGAVPLGERARGILELLRAKVARRRVDEIATEPHAFEDRLGARSASAPAGRLQPGGVLTVAVFVAPEAIGAEAPGDGCQLPHPTRRRPGDRSRPAGGRQMSDASSGLSGQPLRSSPSHKTAPAKVPSGAGTSTCRDPALPRVP